METIREASDETLLAAHRDGDPGAFETLFRRYERPLHRHLWRMLGDRAAAEDLVIETFQRLHAHRDDLRPGAPVRPWIYTIGNNLARNRLRRDRLSRWLPLRSIDRVLAAPDPAGRVGSTDEVQRRVAAALASLPARQREACSLRLLRELPLDEIARATGASVGTVKSRLFYGQRRLRDLLADLAPGEEEGR
jgi:RNA polymerase sigma-70 factor (ECF subfamily)